jgi:hypothetical protein
LPLRRKYLSIVPRGQGGLASGAGAMPFKPARRPADKSL